MLVGNELVCDCFIWKTLVYNRINLTTKIYKILICFLNLFVFDTLCLCGIECMKCCDLFMHVYSLCAIIFLAIESNEECTEEGEVFEYQEEEDQGQANQGKPSKLLHIWILFTCFVGCIKVYEIACFHIAIALVAIVLLAQAPRAYCYHPVRWPPLNTYSSPL
jgi:hypothetical protein